MSDNSEAVRMYALAVEQADRISARRGQANQFYLSLETLILGVPAFFGISKTSPEPLHITVLSVVGVLVSVAWFLQLRSYRDLNSAKFQVINDIEEKHFKIRPFSAEWEILKNDTVERWRPRYAELGAVERLVPIVFAIGNIIVGLLAWF